MTLGNKLYPMTMYIYLKNTMNLVCNLPQKRFKGFS